MSRAQQSSLSSGVDDPCHAEGVTDCASCLSVSGSLCAWCKSSELEIRCNLRATYENGSCSEVVDNTSSVEALEVREGGRRGEVVRCIHVFQDKQTYQVRPREYDVHLRRGMCVAYFCYYIVISFPCIPRRSGEFDGDRYENKELSHRFVLPHGLLRIQCR